jgi:hypothetical protein
MLQNKNVTGISILISPFTPVAQIICRVIFPSVNNISTKHTNVKVVLRLKTTFIPLGRCGFVRDFLEEMVTQFNAVLYKGVNRNKNTDE